MRLPPCSFMTILDCPTAARIRPCANGSPWCDRPSSSRRELVAPSQLGPTPVDHVLGIKTVAVDCVMLQAEGVVQSEAQGVQALGFEKNPGSDLLSHTVTRAVPSAVEGLTSVFGMGTGVTPLLSPPGNSATGMTRRLCQRTKDRQTPDMCRASSAQLNILQTAVSSSHTCGVNEG